MYNKRIKSCLKFLFLTCVSIGSITYSNAVTNLHGLKSAVHNRSDPPPNIFGNNVIIGDPDNIQDLQNKVDAIYNNMWENSSEFSTNRYAILLPRGEYNNLDIKVGYYTEVLGLGSNSPDDVHITGAVRVRDEIPDDPQHPDHAPGALDNFWRGAENLSITPTLGSIDYNETIVPKNQNVWAVSQASPLRRVHIKDGITSGDLRLFDIAWSSGGFMANMQVDGRVIPGSQQQWITRNTDFKNWDGGSWNMVLVGNNGNLCGFGDDDCISMPTDPVFVSHPFMIKNKLPVISEKPFLTYDEAQKSYFIDIPQLKQNSKGHSYDTSQDKKLLVSLDSPVVSIIQPNIDPATNTININKALSQGKSVVLTPGVYHLADTIIVPNKNQIILGLGIPTLIAPGKGIPALKIKDVDGVKIAGLMVQANEEPGIQPTLVQVGDSITHQSHASNPIELYDLYCRVGGGSKGQVDSCLTVHSDDVIGDNLWLWRADHGTYSGWTENTANSGIIVNGNNVSMYGLAVEHFQKYQTIWNGERGTVIFYQSELPYDIPSQNDWNPKDSPSTKGYASYKVSDSVKQHDIYGIGVYCYFRDADNLSLDSAIVTPVGTNVHQAMTTWLNGRANTRITSVINGNGSSAAIINQGHPQYQN